MATTEEFLDHHGVKGMKWGTRKQRKADAKWQKNIYSIHGAVQIHNHVANRMNNGGISSINNSPKYKGKKMLDPVTGEPVGKLGRDYLNDFAKLSEQYTRDAVKEVHGVSPSGHLKAELDTSNPNQWAVKVTRTEVQHIAGVSFPDLILEVEHDENGFITLVSQIKESIAQTVVELGEAFLEHHGVKGMHWGIRNKRPSVTKSKPKKTSLDYRQSQEIRRQKHPYLTNKQIEKANYRANLEQNFNRLNPSKVKRGHLEVKDMLAILGTAVSVHQMATSKAGQALIASGKRAMTSSAAKRAAAQAAKKAASAQGTLF